MTQGQGNSGNTQHIIDFNEVRAQKLEEKRRATERIFFKHLLSVYTVVGDSTMCPIEFIDMSEDGCSFQVPHDTNNPWPKDMTEIPLRIYFSQDTYLEVRATIQNARPSIDGNKRYVRYGCTIDRTLSSYTAYQQFVKFLELYSKFAHKDTGDLTVFYL